jgi:hypothetical protein
MSLTKVFAVIVEKDEEDTIVIYSLILQESGFLFSLSY